MSIVNIPGLPYRLVKPTDGAPTGVLPGGDALVGIDGNAYAVMAEVARILKRAGASPDYIAQYRADATSDDYDRLLAVSIAYLTED